MVYDAHSLEEVKRLPMNKPSGKYNVGNKIGYAEEPRTEAVETPSTDIPVSSATDRDNPVPSRHEKNHGNGG